MPKVGFVSLGCPKNLVDSEVMMGILARGGYEITSRADEADVLVVNTCSFIAPAQQESVQSILEMAEHKKFGRAKKLVVAGCMVERFRDQILEQIPEVDAVVGTGEVERILEACEGELKSLPAEVPTFLYHDLTPRILATPRHTAYIKINEGCDHPCTFCVIPQLRGKFRSRRFESVVREAENLAEMGVREISLIGQDTTFYGEDLGIRDGLPLLHARLAKYMDIPLQHASKNVLARMKRGSHGGAFMKMIERIRRTVPGVSIRTSFIVGFPGETNQDFKVLCDFVREAEFDWMGVFSYSDEDTSESYHLDGKVDAETIAERRDTLMAIQQKITRRRLRGLAGQRVQAMLEGPSKDTDLIWEARMEGMAPEIDGKINITEIAGVNEVDELPPPGTMATVEITGAQDYDLLGRVIEFEHVGLTRLPALDAVRNNLVSISPALAR